MNLIIGKNPMIFIIHFINNFAALIKLVQNSLYRIQTVFLFHLPFLLFGKPRQVLNLVFC